MKSKMFFFFLALISASIFSCSEDEVKRKGDADVTHEGAKWNIASVEYMLIDQSTTGQTFKNGTKENAGAFYFVDGGSKGSFEMNVEGYNKEDVFNYTIDAGSVSIIDIEQSVGVTTNQNILVINGEATDTSMTLEGTITKQSTTGQFVLTVTLSLVKL
jgi:HSP20 family molecular chaperone IbpA